MRAKLSSPNYLKLVIDGDRRITELNLEAFVRGLKLRGREAEFFRALVLYQNSSEDSVRAERPQSLLKIKQRAISRAHTIDTDRLEILKSWRPWVMREMLQLKHFSPEPEWFARQNSR